MNLEKSVYHYYLNEIKSNQMKVIRFYGRIIDTMPEY